MNGRSWRAKREEPPTRRRRALRFGRWGERWVCWWLRLRGYRLLVNNLAGRRGELDLVMSKGDVLHVVEVKTRRHGDPGAALTTEKRRRILAASRRLPRRADGSVWRETSFDLAEVRWGCGWPRVRFVEDAFRADDVPDRPRGAR